MELQVEADQLREQAARQNSVVSSLKKRIQVNLLPLTSGQLKGSSVNERRDNSLLLSLGQISFVENDRECSRRIADDTRVTSCRIQ